MQLVKRRKTPIVTIGSCLLYTSDAADERSSVDLGGRRIINKKNLSTLCRHTAYSMKEYSIYLVVSYTIDYM